MTPEAWLTVGLLVAAIVAMAAGKASDLSLLAVMTALLAFGILTPSEAVAGFSNEGMLTVGALFAVTAGIRETGVLDALATSLLGLPKGVARAQLRMTLPVATLSAFVNNTPVVALMVPVVADWARKLRIPPSKLMIPLSYAAILGGTCTLIGTSTNLVVSGLSTRLDPPVHLELLSPLPLGLAGTAVGIVYIVVVSRWLLPSRGGAEEATAGVREYLVAVRVEPSSTVVGKSVEAAGLRHLPGLFLVEIQRGDDVFAAAGPETRLAAGDTLVFAGVVESVVDLLRVKGLVPATDQLDKLLAPRPDRELVEAVVAPRSRLAGMSIRETRFRSRYDAAVIAVHRGEERLRTKIGDVVLRPGDVLLLETHRAFLANNQNDRDFALLHRVSRKATPRHDRGPLALAVAAALILANALGFVPLLTASLVAALVLVATGCIRAADALEAIEGRVLLTIAAAFAVEAALQKTGAASVLAHGLLRVVSPLGTVGIVAGLYTVTALLTELITNNSAAALMFPLGVETARAAHLPLKPVLLVLMVAASASFSTPIGYQTNMMVYGPGRYRFTDFVRFGVPMQILVGAVTVAVAITIWL